jgi:hypothetical protein
MMLQMMVVMGQYAGSIEPCTAVRTPRLLSRYNDFRYLPEQRRHRDMLSYSMYPKVYDEFRCSPKCSTPGLPSRVI